MLSSSALRVFFLIACTFFLSACNKASDEEQIKLIINQLSKAVEENKLTDIAEFLDGDFRANNNMDAQQIKQLLLMYGMQHQSISITVVNSKTVIDPIYQDKATSTLSVIATGS